MVDAEGRRRRTVCAVVGHGAEARISPSPDGKSVLLSDSVAAREPFHVVAKSVDLRTGRRRQVAPRLDRWSMNARWLPDGRVLLVAGQGTSVKPQVGRLGGAFQPVETGPGVMGGVDCAGGRLFFAYAEAGRPDELQMMPMAGDDGPVALTRVNRALASVRLAKAEVVSWRSRDGLPMEGMLCLPSKPRARKPYPLIVMPHGGPYSASRNQYGQMVVANAFCAAGYACFMPNFRGSIGYGRDFTRKIVRDWGDGPLADIMTGVDSLVRRRIADPKRLAIFGVSYGGHITCWAVGNTRRFRCAVAVAAVTNNISMWGTTDVPTFMLQSSDRPATDFADEFWARQLPLYHAGKVRTPTLVITGEQDVRVPPGQSHEFYRALKAHGVETELILYPREGHGVGEPRHRRHYLETILAWINRHMA